LFFSIFAHQWPADATAYDFATKEREDSTPSSVFVTRVAFYTLHYGWMLLHYFKIKGVSSDKKTHSLTSTLQNKDTSLLRIHRLHWHNKAETFRFEGFQNLVSVMNFSYYISISPLPFVSRLPSRISNRLGTKARRFRSAMWRIESQEPC